MESMKNRLNIIIEFLLWAGVLIAVFYGSALETDSFIIRMSSAAALTLAGYWTIRATRAEREFARERDELKREHQEIGYQKERVESFLELSHDGIIILDKDHHILRINDAVTAITGYTKDEVVGHFCPSVFHCDKYKEMGLCFGLAFLTDDNPSYYEEVAIATKDGRLLDLGVRCARAKKHAGHRGAHLILIRDLTKIHEAESLEHDFVSMTSHQLFTPLSIIRGHISMLLAGDVGKPTSKQHDFLEQSLQATKRMVHLVSELLSISRLEERKITLNFTPTDLSRLIPPLLEQMKPLADSRKIKLVYTKPVGTTAKISIDGEKISQVLQNLIDNAIKYSATNKTVKIVTKVGPNDIQVSITDQGIGIPATDIPKLFQRFFRSANAISIDTKGTGLGLYIARVIVERHNGKIWAESTEHKGSTFYVSLPR